MSSNEAIANYNKQENNAIIMKQKEKRKKAKTMCARSNPKQALFVSAKAKP